jgi:hypothetical protein
MATKTDDLAGNGKSVRLLELPSASYAEDGSLKTCAFTRARVAFLEGRISTRGDEAMTHEELDSRNARVQNETLVISRSEEGFRVYNPADPGNCYTVGGGPDAPTCTCPDFKYHQNDPNWRCKHILTVLNQVGGPTDGDTYYATEERRAIQAEGDPIPDLSPDGKGRQMVIKRSVSPDKRIDALSVEISCPLGTGDSDDVIRSQAAEVIKLQDQIVQSFLTTNGKEASVTTSGGNGGNGPAPAKMLGVGGINTKWGRRLYIAIESNGSKLKLFGSRKQLADALVTAGHAQLAERIDEGKPLNVPCRVVTRPSEDGRYINVEQVLPVETRPERRAW